MAERKYLVLFFLILGCVALSCEGRRSHFHNSYYNSKAYLEYQQGLQDGRIGTAGPFKDYHYAPWQSQSGVIRGDTPSRPPRPRRPSSDRGALLKLLKDYKPSGSAVESTTYKTSISPQNE